MKVKIEVIMDIQREDYLGETPQRTLQESQILTTAKEAVTNALNRANDNGFESSMDFYLVTGFTVSKPKRVFDAGHVFNTNTQLCLYCGVNYEDESMAESVCRRDNEPQE